MDGLQLTSDILMSLCILGIFGTILTFGIILSTWQDSQGKTLFTFFSFAFLISIGTVVISGAIQLIFLIFVHFPLSR